MVKPSGNFSVAVGSLSTAVAIGSAGTGANFASAALLGAPCIQEGGAAGACAEGAGAGLVIGCDPGPAPGWAEGGTVGWLGGLTAGCCAQAGAAAAIPAATAPNNKLRERDRMEFIAIPPGSFSKIPAPCERTHARVVNGGERIAIRYKAHAVALRSAARERRACEKLC